MHRRCTRVFAVAGALAVLSCAAEIPIATKEGAEDCSIVGQNRAVRDRLREIYLWYRELPDLDPAAFPSPEAYLQAARYKPFDSGFSYIESTAASEAFLENAKFVGFGFRWGFVAADDLRIKDVYAGSPADEAGLRRGMRVLAIDGRSVPDLLASGGVSAALGPNREGVTVVFRVRDRDGRERELATTKRELVVPVVSVERTLRVGDRAVGYVVLENFITPAIGALDAAFSRFRAEGVQELVLDLRYNGGGLLDVSQHLAGLIGGARTRGAVFTRLVHNDKNSHLDQDFRFPTTSQELNVQRFVVITTDASASASELMINGLRPFMNVTVVGDRTFGKPVGQHGRDFCEKRLWAVAFFTRNARNEGDYFGGIPADCAAPDDLMHDFGDPAEGSLATALEFLRTGRCSPAAAATARSHALRRPPAAQQPHRENGWQQLVGAH